MEAYGSLWNPSQSVQPKSKSKVSRSNLSFQIQGHFPIFGFLPQPHGLVTVEDVAPLTCSIQTSMLQSNTFRSWVSLTIAFPILGSFATALPSHSTQRCALRRLAQVKLSGRSLRQMLIQGGMEIPKWISLSCGFSGPWPQRKIAKTWPVSRDRRPLIVACGPRRIWLLPTPWGQMPGWETVTKTSQIRRQKTIFYLPKFDPCFWHCLGIFEGIKDKIFDSRYT